METKQKVMKFVVRFVLLNAHLLFPAIYLLVGVLLLWFDQISTFTMEGLVFCAVLGALVCYTTRAWLSHKYDEDELDLIGLDELQDPEDKKYRLSDFTHDMPWWERLLWIVIVMLMVLNGVFLFDALQYMFASGNSLLSGAITVVLQLVLLVLLMMISRKRRLVWVVLAYVVIDFCGCYQVTEQMAIYDTTFYYLFCTLFLAPLALALLIAAVRSEN